MTMYLSTHGLYMLMNFQIFRKFLALLLITSCISEERTPFLLRPLRIYGNLFRIKHMVYFGEYSNCIGKESLFHSP